MAGEPAWEHCFAADPSSAPQGRRDSGHSPHGREVQSGPVPSSPGVARKLCPLGHVLARRSVRGAMPLQPLVSLNGQSEACGREQNEATGPDRASAVGGGAARGRRPGRRRPLGSSLTMRLRPPPPGSRGGEVGGQGSSQGHRLGLLALTGHSAFIHVQGLSLRCDRRGPAVPGDPPATSPEGLSPSAPDRPPRLGRLAQ